MDQSRDTDPDQKQICSDRFHMMKYVNESVAHLEDSAEMRKVRSGKH